MEDKKFSLVGVIGSGVMGHGIAQTAAKFGYDVIMHDIAREFLDNGLRMIKEGRYGLERAVKSGKMTESDASSTLGRIKTSTNLEDLKNCDIVIEAITEDEKLKGDLFQKLDRVLKPDGIIASNTSGIMISKLASYTKRGEKFIGMHWFNPPQLMKLIEIVRGPETSEYVLESVTKMSIKMEKVPVTVNDGPGFFTTRYIDSWLMEAFRMFENGVAGIQEIDKMSKLAFGFPMGPFELSDLVGLDTMLHISEYMFEETKRPEYAAPSILKKLVYSGYLGNKKGSKGGWYDYYKIVKQ